MKTRKSSNSTKRQQIPVKSNLIPAAPKDPTWRRNEPPPEKNDPPPPWTKHPMQAQPPHPNDVSVQGSYDVPRLSNKMNKKKKV
jgi:hypothetical protein